MSARRRRAAFWLGPLGLAMLGAAAALIVAAGTAERTLSGFVLGGLGESFSTRIWSAPHKIPEGGIAPPERLRRRLERLGYKRVGALPDAPGRYRWDERTLSVWLRGFSGPQVSQQRGLYELDWDGQSWTIRSAAGEPPAELWLEPELVSELSGPKKVRRDPAASEEIPRALKDAVVAAEDKRFYTHWGLDLRAIARAIWANLRGRAYLQGASTITQQLSKNLFLTPRRSLRRKLSEAALSLYLELRFGKDRLLTLYLNHIYLGQDGSISVAGVKSAARFYFDKELSDLSLGESALIAGVIRSPHRYNPRRDAQAARARRDFVLKRMREERFIDDAALAKARREPLSVKPSPSRKTETADSAYFVAELVRELLPRHGERDLYQLGLSIHSTMDPLLQHEAQAALKRLKYQGALVALEPQSGRVLALAGGRDFSQSQFNRATQAQRQPGSAFKPFVFAAALERGYTAATVLDDRPRSYPRSWAGEPGKSWDPRNYDGVYLGTATMRQALALSLNAATLDLAARVGMSAIEDLAERLGIESPIARELGAALGSSETSLLELSAAYAPFANGGFRVEPHLAAAVLDAEGAVLEFAESSREPVLSPAHAALMSSFLRSVATEGTARRLPQLGFARPAAGKTGTTNDGRDAWFIGFTPQLLAGVWIGDDAQRRIGVTGAKDALPVWAEFMRQAAKDQPDEPFVAAEGLIPVTIDPGTGARARSGCPVKREELFVPGTEPTEDCPVHIGGLRGFFKRWFQR